MPRLNPTGELWCAGIAGAGFYGGTFDTAGIPRVIVEQQNAGMRGFLNDEEAVTQFGDSQILALNCRTGAKRVAAHHGGSEVQAGGGVWATFFHDGVRTSTGLHLPSAYIGASTGPMRNECVGPDGQVAIKEQYHSFGPWHVYRRDGSRWLLAQGDAANIQLLAAERGIYREGWTWHARGGLPVPRPLTTIAWGLKLFETPEGWWIQYQAEDGRVLVHPNEHPAGSATGYVLGQATDAHGLDVMPLADGRFRSIWATSEGEAPWSLVATTFRLTDPRVALKAIHVPLPPPPPPPPVEEPEPDPMPEIPNHSALNARRWAELGMTVRDSEDANRDQSVRYLRRMASELNQLEGANRWGLLEKTSGNRWQDAESGKDVSVDFLAYNTGADRIPHVDLITDATGSDWIHGVNGDPNNKRKNYGPSWGTEHGLVDEDRFVPVSGGGEPVPVPQPHAYDGGDNDTGICDRCGQPREAAIHRFITPPPPPAGDLETLKAELSATKHDVAELTRWHQELAERVGSIVPQDPTEPIPVDLELLAREIAKRTRSKSTGGFLGHRHPHEVIPPDERQP